MGEIFRDFGYLYAQVIPVESLDPKNKIVNVTFNVYEGEVAFLHRLEFRGNAYTKDKVIRREMMHPRGRPLQPGLFKDSILRIKQLGLVDLEKDPDIKPNPDDPTQIDVQVNVKELQRNNIQFTAGYSGYEGTFVAFSYSTVNFLGAGENLEFTDPDGQARQELFLRLHRALPLRQADHGRLQHLRPEDRLSLWLYNQKTQGHRPDAWAPRLVRHTGGPTSPTAIQNVEITVPEGQPVSAAITAMYGIGKYNISSIEPLLYRSTIDSPLTPDARDDVLRCRSSSPASFLGGEIGLINRPRIEFTHFQPFIANPRHRASTSSTSSSRP